ncbi:MAG: hypothetical protein PHV28_06560 [Kiritimatiellae bacterium]|nr:hypothetical protein [Kiritimatiellia bacterium]
MKKNVLIVVLIVAVAALAFTVARKDRQLETAMNAARQEREARKTHAESVSKTARTERGKEKTGGMEQASPVETQVARTEPVAPAVAKATGVNTNFMGALADMMKNPQMKEMMRAQQKVMIGKMYAALPRYLNLPDETKARLDQLLLDRQLAMAEAGLAMMNGSAEDRRKAAEDSKAVKAESDQAIQELLGAQDYEVFKQYEASLSEQTNVSLFKDTLSGDDALGEQQEYDLVAAMYQARETLPQDSLLNQQNQSPDPTQLTEERVAETLKQMETLQQRYAEAAATVLSAGQLERFKQWQQQMATMQRTGLNMAAQMFNSGKSSGATSQH